MPSRQRPDRLDRARLAGGPGGRGPGGGRPGIRGGAPAEPAAAAEGEAGTPHRDTEEEWVSAQEAGGASQSRVVSEEV